MFGACPRAQINLVWKIALEEIKPPKIQLETVR